MRKWEQAIKDKNYELIAEWIDEIEKIRVKAREDFKKKPKDDSIWQDTWERVGEMIDVTPFNNDNLVKAYKNLSYFKIYTECWGQEKRVDEELS